MDETDRTVWMVVEDGQARSVITGALRGRRGGVRRFDSFGGFLEAYAPRHPQCVIAEVGVKDADEVALQHRLLDRGIRSPVILVGEGGAAPVIVRSIKAGAFDFLVKPVQPQRVVEVVDGALDQDAIAERRRRRRDEIGARIERLTERERVVFDLVIAGQPSKQIAQELGISKRTVDQHRTSILRKMEVARVVELVRIVLDGRSDE